ncbi:MAG: pyridoxamine 5'-phosphate oxidase family protein [Desulfococcaceae bacterium]
MELKEYFASASGLGVLATSDREGNVDAAVYARPTVMDDGTLAFIMNDRLSHQNLLSNPRATYLFKEERGYRGKRLHMSMVREEKDSPLISELSKRAPSPEREKQAKGSKFLVFFKVDKERPLVGG